MLRIKSWLERFEDGREKDRPRKATDWVKLPCDFQSTGYLSLMSSPSGAQHLGVFVALMELVGALKIELRDGSLIGPRGDQLSLKELSIKTRIPEKILHESIAALKLCGWLEECGFL